MKKKRFIRRWLLACMTVCMGLGAHGSLAIAQSPDARFDVVVPPPIYDERHVPYSTYVMKELHKRIFYPKAAEDAGITGAVAFSFTVGPNGRVEGHKIHTSSGHPVLDDAVGKILDKIRLGPPPNGSYRASTSFKFMSPKEEDKK